MSKEKKWITSVVLAGSLAVVFGLLLLLMPNIIKVSNESVGNFGLIVLAISVVCLLICFTAAFKLKKAAKVSAGIMAIICIPVALLGYFAFWWFNT